MGRQRADNANRAGPIEDRQPTQKRRGGGEETHILKRKSCLVSWGFIVLISLFVHLSHISYSKEGGGNKRKESQSERTISVGRKSLGKDQFGIATEVNSPLKIWQTAHTRKGGRREEENQEAKQNFSLNLVRILSFGPRAKRCSQIRGSVRWQLKKHHTRDSRAREVQAVRPLHYRAQSWRRI